MMKKYKWILEFKKEINFLKSINLDDGVEKGSTAAISWLNRLTQVLKEYPQLLATRIYESNVYQALVRTCNMEQLERLENLQNELGFSWGMRNFVNELNRKMTQESENKRIYIDNRLLDIKMKKMKEDMERWEKEKQEKIKKEEEEKRKFKFDVNKEYPGGMNLIPLSEFQKVKFIDIGAEKDNNGNTIIDWIITLPIYNCYGLIYTLNRESNNNHGKIYRRLEIARSSDELRRRLKSILKNELDMINKQRIKAQDVDISHVEKIMGIDFDNDIDDDLSGDIF